jgi:dihydroorotate dehydrogenase
MLYRSILRPLLFRLPPETAHEMALHFCAAGLRPPLARRLLARSFESDSFNLQRFGLSFRSPVGLAAGFDKNGVAAEGLAALGFGFIEVGTVTNLAQEGNARPRLFRLSLDRALINRMGFNNDGARAVAENLKSHRPANCVLGVNIGKSRAVSVEDAVADYLASFESVYEVADYVAVNVSSPNTPGLRQLQHADALYALLQALQTRNHELATGRADAKPLPLLVKIAPDLQEQELEAIVDVALRAQFDGIIATNTTTSRAGLKTRAGVVSACGEGGLSGEPLRARSNEIIASLYRLTRGRLPIVGVGGIFNTADAWDKICAGACLVQIYTGFIYEGPGVVRDINEGLRERLTEQGFRTLDEAVGSQVKASVAA